MIIVLYSLLCLRLNHFNTIKYLILIIRKNCNLSNIIYYNVLIQYNERIANILIKITTSSTHFYKQKRFLN